MRIYQTGRAKRKNVEAPVGFQKISGAWYTAGQLQITRRARLKAQDEGSIAYLLDD